MVIYHVSALQLTALLTNITKCRIKVYSTESNIVYISVVLQDGIFVLELLLKIHPSVARTAGLQLGHIPLCFSLHHQHTNL